MLHPQARRALAAAAGAEPVHAEGFDIDVARRRAREEAAVEPRVPVAEVRDVDAGGVPCRSYRPEDAAAGVLVHLHGGGFVFHDVDVHDNLARRLARASGLTVLSVDYRRPPEHRFPAAPDDVDTVLAWLGDTGPSAGLTGPIHLHGDSAGGNLALVAALRNPGRARTLSLSYPFLDPECAGESYDQHDIGFEPAEAHWYWQQYAAHERDLLDPDLAPLRSPHLATLPPTLVTTAEHDPLRDEGELLAQRLAELGVVVVATRYLGQLHGFLRHPDVFDAADALTGQVAGFVRTHS